MSEPMETKQATIMTVLKALVSNNRLNANSLAKALNLPPPTINRLLTGEVQDPRASTLCSIAHYFGITVDQLLGHTPIMDSRNENSHLFTKPKFSVPVLTMAEATDYKRKSETTHQWLHWQTEHSNKNIYAVIIKNSIYEPVFIDGTFLMIDPELSVLSGYYVLVKFKGDSTAVIKKYMSEGQDKYLYPIKNDVKIITLDDSEHSIIGVIIEAYRCLTI